MSIRYSFLRFRSVLHKEFIQMRHEYLTYLCSVLIPFLQVIFFGYVIDTDPKHLPTVVIASDHSNLVMDIIRGLENTNYFDIKGLAHSEAEAEKMLQINRAQFVLNIPPGFSRDLIRGRQPHILLEADATDPVAVNGAYRAANNIIPSVLDKDFRGSLDYLLSGEHSFVLDLHSNYNPNVIAQYHSLPGLLAVFLTSILVVLAAVSMASEYEQGTFETLLLTPAKPIDIVLGKLFPHFLIGYSIYFLILVTSYWGFNIPFYGSVVLLTVIAAPFMLATLGVGLIVSIFSKTQLGAVTYGNLYILPAMLLSGFIFPFWGMPGFARFIGELFPTTHFLRVTYSIMLKDVGFLEVWPDVWPILAFLGAIIGLCVLLYRKTLD